MTDRELLELAAKAAQIKVHPAGFGISEFFVLNSMGLSEKWNPLTNDGDALRLAVKLCLVVDIDEEARVVWVTKPWCAACPVSEPFDDDPFSAARRAIVRAAAAIQLSKESK